MMVSQTLNDWSVDVVSTSVSLSFTRQRMSSLCAFLPEKKLVSCTRTSPEIFYSSPGYAIIYSSYDDVADMVESWCFKDIFLF